MCCRSHSTSSNNSSSIVTISNRNWTEWSTIQGVIARVISKSDEREARGPFEIQHPPSPGHTPGI